MKPYSGGIRHDYKDSVFEVPGDRVSWPWLVFNGKPRWPWFAVGVSLPLLAVAILLFSVSSPGNAPEAKSTATNALASKAGQLQSPASAPRAAGGAANSGASAIAGASKTSTPVAAASEAAGASGNSTISAALASTARSHPPPGALVYFGDAPPKASELDIVVKKGDSLDRLFRRNDLSLADLAAMMHIKTAADELKTVMPGDSIRIFHDGEHVVRLTRKLDDTKLLSIEDDAGSYAAKDIELPVERRQATAHGTIESSLFEAGSAAGISDSVILGLADIFKWDIDFIQDVRAGDSFTLIYAQRWRHGVKLGDGPILAAEFVNQGEVYRAARYTDPQGHSDYYTPDGHSLRKAFIRAPVDFTRISSKFDMHRYHPILHRVRPHRGVDYAAPTGTPVHAAGDGTVIFRGKKGGYGNVVVLKHGGHITTLYAHLSRFGKYKVGSEVDQGDVIAYVGMTGLATGPHLHYEYRVNGVARNPRTVKLPSADPVPKQDADDFKVKTAPLFRELDALDSEPRITTAAN